MRILCDEILFRNEENGYTVASIRYIGEMHEGVFGDPDFFSEEGFKAVGAMPMLNEGDEADVEGDWKVHPIYGRQLVVTFCRIKEPTDPEAIFRYLTSEAVQGIGPKLAGKIIAKFGENTLYVISDTPDKLTSIKGVSAAKAQRLSLQIRENLGMQELFLLLQGHGFGSATIMKIYKRYGLGAAQMVRSDPYRLADEIHGIGFLTADKIALAEGLNPVSVARLKSALRYVLTQCENEGHTYLTAKQMVDKCANLLDYLQPEGTEAPPKPSTEMWLSVMIELSDRGALVCFHIGTDLAVRILQSQEDLSAMPLDKVRISASYVLDKEIKSAKIMSSKLKATDQTPLFHDCLADIEKATTEMSIRLAPEQQSAVIAAVSEKVSIVTGGPGTGKTTIIRVIVHYFSAKGKEVVLCAPTGRAAKRMAEASGHDASTIHRLLEVQRDSDEDRMVFSRNSDNPIQADVIIVDEVSMMDSSLFFFFISAVSPETVVVFVGDQDQLPSVGAGNVLADLISSEKVPVTRLTQIFRQSEESEIVKNAHRVLHGQDIVFNQSFDSDCMLISRSSGEDILDAVVKLCSKVLPEQYGVDVFRDVIILSPAKKGSAGVLSLNESLQKALETPNEDRIVYRSFTYSVGTKVIQIRNNYELSYRLPDQSVGMGVFNGEVGFVQQVHHHGLVVEFEDGRVVEYGTAQLEDLETAYALTVHKSQGSEYPIVVLAVPGGPPMLNHRNLLYTALTRAKKRVFIVSSKETLRRMIWNKSNQKRQTSLSAFLVIYANTH